MDNKRTYYVTIDGSINTDQNLDNAPYDYEIQATETEINNLQDLFQQAYNEDWDTYIQSHLPFQTEDRQKASTDVDEKIREIYNAIYHLGTEETKRSIKSLGIVDLL